MTATRLGTSPASPRRYSADARAAATIPAAAEPPRRWRTRNSFPSSRLYWSKNASISPRSASLMSSRSRRSRWVVDSTATAMTRSFRTTSPSRSRCSTSNTPMSRTSTRQPTGSGASVRTRMSTGSPSSAVVSGTNPKSNGNDIPTGRTWLSRKRPAASSHLSLFWLPFGVSTTTSMATGMSRSASLQRVLRQRSVGPARLRSSDRLGMPCFDRRTPWHARDGRGCNSGAIGRWLAYGWRARPALHAAATRQEVTMSFKRLWRDYSLSIFVFAIFLASFLLHAIFGWWQYVADQTSQGQDPTVFGWSGYIVYFGEWTFQNWQSEFLEVLLLIVATTYLIHRGSPES